MPEAPRQRPGTTKTRRNIVQQIQDGDHDDKLAEIRAAVEGRYVEKRDEVLALVKEVYGDNYYVAENTPNLTTPTVEPDLPTPTVGDPFAQPVEIISAPGPGGAVEPAAPEANIQPDPMSDPEADIESHSPVIS
jgi:hypothetical protein